MYAVLPWLYCRPSSARHDFLKLLPGKYRAQLLVQFDGPFDNLQAFPAVAPLHLEECVRLQDLGGAGAFLVLGIFRQNGAEEVQEHRPGALDVVHALLEQGQQERRHGQPGVVAPVLVVPDLVDDAPVQRLGLVELAALDEVPSKVVPLGLADLGLQFVGAGPGEGPGQLAARSALLLPRDGGVVLQAPIDPLSASLVENAMGWAPCCLLLWLSTTRIVPVAAWLLRDHPIIIGRDLVE